MNEVIKAILTRVSVRKFTDQKIEADKLKIIVDCAKASPTAMNRQARKFTVVQNREKIRELEQGVEKILNRPHYRIYNCDALIFISFAADDRYGVCDSSVAIQNIYLAAQSLGLGSVWINQLRDICNEPSMRAILDSFHIPANHIVCGISALGYPAEEPLIKERTELVEYIY